MIAQSFTFRIILSFTVCACLLWLPNVSLLKSEAAKGQSAGRTARPLAEKPEGTWPDLEEVKNESALTREPPAPIPSTATLMANITLSGTANNASSLITARVEPRNQPGNGMLSRDVSWSVPLLSLPGRNGLELGLTLA